ncbi:MAG TPA: UDP-N-acetylglucosamine--LPS N-acetylglucosamine transferase [Planctomycetes bacterium]|nr:UDP-N-acetylglucosamine--LPS N-acetylglucosamine transferase [Planctomycetota bacterium]
MTRRQNKVLAVSSGGGHWVQLERLLPAFEGMRLFVATVEPRSAGGAGAERVFRIIDASRWEKLRLLRSAFGLLAIVLRVRPDVMISTGAAPGFFALLFGKMIGSRTIWVDSVANADELSMSGKKAGRVADLWLTQWEHLAREGGPQFRGSVF